MVRGIQKFKEYFRGYENQYTVIGGVACDVLMEDVGQEFRATKDLDIVLMVEAMTSDFVRRFWEYIEAAGYEHRNKSTGEVQFYRFRKPTDNSWVHMIELFSRKPDTVFLLNEPTLTPIPVGEEISSLSAILLNDDYYDFLKGGRVVIDGVPVLEEKHLIPFKARAFLDNMSRLKAGEQIHSRDIKKHKNDVFRLSLMLPVGGENMELPDSIRNDMKAFLEMMKEDDVDVKSLGGGTLKKEDLIKRLTDIYLVAE